MVARGQNFKEIPLNVVGSSVFGRYPKISSEKTYNMFISDDFLVPYPGYEIALLGSKFGITGEGRGIFASTKLGTLVVVIGSGVYLASLTYNHQTGIPEFTSAVQVGALESYFGPVYIAENNKPQIGISDNESFYIYDSTISTTLPYPNFTKVPLDFTPGYLTFHDTYFILAASNDGYLNNPGQLSNNTWRLSLSNEGYQDGSGNSAWLNTSAKVGLLQTKPDNTKAVVRFPSKGNMIFVMGSIVTEAWFDTGAALFPYQRQNQFNVDYGCAQPATVAYSDEMVVWLASNEKSGFVILASNGGIPKKITTDGIDYLLSTLNNPSDSQAFMYRQDGHVFYHINFYTDNLSLVYDFNTEKFYHACDQNLNYFIASEVAFFNNQYYFVSKNSPNIYAFATDIYTYQDTDSAGNVLIHEVPRIRVCANIRAPDQDYSIFNDIGFTIESGEINYQQQSLNEIILISQDGIILRTQGGNSQLITQDEVPLISQDGVYLVPQQVDPDNFAWLIAQQEALTKASDNLSLPHVDLSISTDGGASFGTEWAYYLPPIGNRKNRLMWWQLGLANDFVPMFKFWGLGRFVVTDGLVHVRR